MGREYTGTLRWGYGQWNWSMERGDYLVTGFHDEGIELLAQSNEEAYGSAMEIARKKINESELPGRPRLGTIHVILLNLMGPKGEVDLSKKESCFERPVFKTPSLNR